ncbi:MULTISPECIES: hypothetical protein [Bacillus cereus group]|uniref:hypothetical protein n=1 Tax=Bacillus cereus group TaxID=86661 RepID=UPI0011C91D3B|nr:hypothetical protein [Bacillus sp. AR18-7]TXR66899.1 hypothetical protein DN395_04270 [Bacillus sp. AR18-7]
MTFEDVIYNFLIGLVSGGVSGYIVSLYFKKGQEKRELSLKKEQGKRDWLIEFDKDKQNLNNFLYAIRIEMDILVDDIKNDVKFDISDTKRIFSNHPRTPTFKDNLTKESSEKLIKARTLIDKIENTISSEITLKELNYYQKELFKARIDVLSLKSNKYD